MSTEALQGDTTATRKIVLRSPLETPGVLVCAKTTYTTITCTTLNTSVVTGEATHGTEVTLRHGRGLSQGRLVVRRIRTIRFIFFYQLGKTLAEPEN